MLKTILLSVTVFIAKNNTIGHNQIIVQHFKILSEVFLYDEVENLYAEFNSSNYYCEEGNYQLRITNVITKDSTSISSSDYLINKNTTIVLNF